MAINPNNFKQIQDVLAQQQGKSDSQVTGAAHNMQNNLLHKGKPKHKKKKSSAKAMQAAIAARMAKKKAGN